MRVATGKFRGRKLQSGKDQSIRPTTNKVKESIFNILQDFCQKKIVLDLFCGSGSLGIESLSHGALHVTFVDKSRNSVKVLQNNLDQLHINPDQYTVITKDALKFAVLCDTTFDIILIDPPIKYPLLNRLINILFNNSLLTTEGIMIVEHEIDNPITYNQNQRFRLFKQKQFGRSIITFLINTGENSVS